LLQPLSRINRMDRLKNIGLLILGWFFICLGILGLFLPVLQGVLFIMIGLAILSTRSALIMRLLRYLEERYPKQHAKVEIWKKKAENWFRKKTS
jgi:uncharacterized protein